MNKQTVMWTALPNGITMTESGGVRLKLSVFVSLRLWTDEGLPTPTLSQFADVRHWAATPIAGFQVQFGSNPFVPATRVGDLPRTDLWDALFTDTTYVKPYGDATGQTQAIFDRFSSAPILSYSVKNVQSFLKGQYTNIAATAGTEFPAAQALLAPDSFAQIATLGVPGIFNPGMNEAALADKLTGLLSTGSKVVPVPGDPPSPPWDFFLLKQFLHPRTTQRITLPVPEIDFHRMLSALRQYPLLLRQLGLVHDLELDLPLVNGAPPGDTTVQVIAQWTPQEPNTLNVPYYGRYSQQRLMTRCRANRQTFVALPRPNDPDIFDGMLNFDDPNAYEVVQIDPDGAAVKCMTLANNLVRATIKRPSDDTPTSYSVPSLRTAGLSVVKVDRAAHMHNKFTIAGQLNQAHEAGQDVTLSREDVTGGYAVDVWDSLTQSWHSLCRRVGDYHFLTPNLLETMEDEGWIGTSLTSAAEGSAPDFSMHESIARWWGWSLAAPRPGKTIDRNGQAAPMTNTATTGFQLEVSFRPKPGSLPRLRYGVSYRLRARAVDLAGNRLTLDDLTSAGFLHATPPVTHGRFEPVSAPALVFRKPRTEGESAQRLVIRSNYDTWADVTAERHIAPPKSDETMAEAHMLFDNAATGQVDTAVYQLLLAKPSPTDPPDRQWEGGSFADIGTADSANYDLPYVDADRLKLPYLPDPLSRGVFFSALPGVSGPFKMDFGYAAGQVWPNAQPFLFVLKEGTDPPNVDLVNRVLVVYLPKAEVATLRLNSYLDSGDLQKLGLLYWMFETFGALSVKTMQFVDQVAKAQHWMVTPYRTLTLVHAVRQPLLEPQFYKLQVNKLLGETFATLSDPHMIVSRKSTSTIDYLGTWTENVDPLEDPHPKEIAVKAKAFQVHVPLPGASDEADALEITGRHEFFDTKYRHVFYSAVATTRFGEYFVERKKGITLSSTTPFSLDPAGVVEWSEAVRAAGGSASYVRDQDYTMDYAAGTIEALASLDGKVVDVSYLVPPITRQSPKPLEMDIPNSARPLAPKALYAIPTFDWKKTGKPGDSQFYSQRDGSALRVYLERPWWSSGNGELLGVVLYPGALPIPERIKPFMTQWGLDPVYQSKAIAPLPTLDAFKLSTKTGQGLSLDELPGVLVDVAGHEVVFDEARQLWYCDIEIDAGGSYCPFVRLALARFQPISVPNAHLSRVVLADFIQLTPKRSASLTRGVTYGRPTLQVTVFGDSYQMLTGVAGPSRIEVSVEKRRPGLNPALAEELVWSPASRNAVVLQPGVSPRGTPLWQGTLGLPSNDPGPFRVVIKEFELFGPDAQRRLVYADAIEI